MESLRVKIEATVYSKILFHGAKYPSFPLVGILVGSDQENSIHVQDILPVYHSPPVGSLFDIALLSIPEIFVSMKPIGIYFSTERNDSDAWPHYINKFVECIKAINSSSGSGCLTVQLKNSLLENMEVLCLNATSGARHPELVLVPNALTPRNANTMVNSMLTENLHRYLQDMEDHTDHQSHQGNAGDDIRNRFVETAVSEYLQKNSK